MRRWKELIARSLTCWAFVSALMLLADAQQRAPVYPRGALLLYRNLAAPIRYATLGGSNRFRANINFENEPIECAILLKGSDGNFYSNARSRFLSGDGWVIAAGSGDLTVYDLLSLENVQARSWSSTNTQVELTIEWYRLERTKVDRETIKTRRSSPMPPNYRDRNGNSFIRYYLADIKREGMGWQQIFTLPRGGIIAPIVCIRWEERKADRVVARSIWIPGSNQRAPLPGMNDCLGLSSWNGNCQGEFSEPLRGASYNQYYGQRSWRNWAYEPIMSGVVYWFPFYVSIAYPVQYPIFVFNNLGELMGGHSMLGVNCPMPGCFIPFDTPAWWRIHIATIYEEVPYEWGGKYYAAEASGARSSYIDSSGRGTNAGFGLDCSGLIAVANRSPNNTHYGTGTILAETDPIQYYNSRQRRWLPDWNAVRPGDVFIRHHPGGSGNHVMLILYVFPPVPGSYPT